MSANETTSERSSTTVDGPDIPACLQHLPRYGALPVPFFTAVIDGRPDFRAHDPGRHAQAMLKRLCGICGRPLDYWLYFVFGPASLPSRISYMPPMHRACVMAALDLCPFLAVQDRTHREARERLDTVQLVERHEVPMKPDRVGVVATRAYDVVYPKNRDKFGDSRSAFRGEEYAKIAAPKRVDWYRYVDGRLQPESAP